MTLPRLTGIRVGLSVSDSPDLARLGMVNQHLTHLIRDLTRTVCRLGGGFVYGGHPAAGHAAAIRAELGQFPADTQLVAFLAWHVHRQMPLPEIIDVREQLDTHGRLVCLDLDGRMVDPATGRGDAPEPVTDPQARDQAMTATRETMRIHQVGRVFIGGHRDTTSVLEEALLALQAGQPCYLAGGFGGVTMDMVQALGLDDTDVLPPQHEPEGALAAGLTRLTQLAHGPGWTWPDNGLTDDENRQLAVTYRTHEIAVLVTTGLLRLAHQLSPTLAPFGPPSDAQRVAAAAAASGSSNSAYT